MMENIREKLVELLKRDPCPSTYLCDGNCKYADLERCFEERFADHLIANNVTVQEQYGCDYCREDFDGYVRRNGAFLIRNSHHREGWTISAGNVKPRQIYYCPMCGRALPQPPKGE